MSLLADIDARIALAERGLIQLRDVPGWRLPDTVPSSDPEAVRALMVCEMEALIAELWAHRANTAELYERPLKSFRPDAGNARRSSGRSDVRPEQ